MTSGAVTQGRIAETGALIRPHVRCTPNVVADGADFGLPPGPLVFKLEQLQHSGSFKARGAFANLLLRDVPAAGVVAASGGNHGAALAYGAWRLGLPATIFLTERASDDRVARVTTWGAQVVKHGAVWDEAHARAVEHAAATGSTYVHPFDAERTLIGQGTLGLELLDDVPALDCVLIAIGGGGLIAGMAAAIKQLRPQTRIIGVEPTGAASMRYAVAAGQVLPLPEVHTIADTLAPRAVCARTLALTQQYVDEIVTVSDAQMVSAMRWLWAECNQLVEPAGAAVIAALQNSAVDIGAHTHPVALICGGNAAVESAFANYTV